jgi:hypothetical protein
LGFFKYCTPLSVLFSVEGLFPSSRNASLICFRANVLSNGVIGMSPQSTIFAHDVYGFRFARELKPRKDVWREEPARIARGPKRAPGRYETAVSKGAPRMAMSYVVSGWVKQRVCGRCAKVDIPEKPHCSSLDRTQWREKWGTYVYTPFPLQLIESLLRESIFHMVSCV